MNRGTLMTQIDRPLPKPTPQTQQIWGGCHSVGRMFTAAGTVGFTNEA